MRSALSLLVAALVILFLAPPASAGEPRRLTWDQLHQLVGKRVSIPLYEGCAVSGKVLDVHKDSLVIQVSKTSNPKACGRGTLRVPRARLYVLDVHRNRIRHTLTGTAQGVLAVAGRGTGKGAGQSTTTIQIVP
jgi:hypothetical protein